MQNLMAVKPKYNLNSQKILQNSDFADIYFSSETPFCESEFVFLQANNLLERFKNHQSSTFHIVETGFGTGINFITTLALFTKFKRDFPNAKLQYLFFSSIEKYPFNQSQLTQIYANFNQHSEICAKILAQYPYTVNGIHRLEFHLGDKNNPVSVFLDLNFNDIDIALDSFGEYMFTKIDCWFLDGFSPSRNPQMWSEKLFAAMQKYSKPMASFATFTSARMVRDRLEQAGFSLTRYSGFAKKRQMLKGFLQHKLEPKIDNDINSRCFYLKNPHQYFPKIDENRWQQTTENTTNNLKCAVIGAGIGAFCCAYELNQRGIEVEVFSEEEFIGEKSCANKIGAFYPQLSDDDLDNIRFYLHCFSYAKNKYREFYKKFNFKLDLSGVALTAYNHKASQKLAKICDLKLDENIICRKNSDELTKLAGVEVKHEGLFFPEGGYLSPIELLQNGFNYLVKNGVKIHFKQKITDLDKFKQQHNFSHIILANGFNINSFPQTKQLAFYPVRGQVSEHKIDKNQDDTLNNLNCVLCFDGYLTPMSNDNFHCLGASHVRDCTDLSFSLTEQQQNYNRLKTNLACSWAENLTVQNYAKVGVRTALRDRIPMVGAVPNFELQLNSYHNLFNLKRRKEELDLAAKHDGIYMLAGFSSRGFCSAPLCAATLVSMILDQALPIPHDLVQKLNPNRQWVRKWLKGSKVELRK